MLHSMSNGLNKPIQKTFYIEEEKKRGISEVHWSWSLIAGTIIIQVTVPSILVSYGVISFFLYSNEEFSWNNYWTPVVYTATWLISEPWFRLLCNSIESSVEFMYISIVGTILAWVGILLSVFSQLTPSHLVGLLGFLGGLGTSMCLSSSECLLERHFPLRSGVIRTCIQMMSALSLFVMPVISYFIMSIYGQKGGILIHSTIVMQGLIGAVLMKYKKIPSEIIREIRRPRAYTIDGDEDSDVVISFLRAENIALKERDASSSYQIRNWKNPVTETPLSGEAAPPTPPNTPDLSPYKIYNRYSNNFNERTKPVIIVKNKILSSKKHKRTKILGVDILPKIPEGVEDDKVISSSEDEEEVVELRKNTTKRDLEDRNSPNWIPNAVPKPKRKFISSIKQEEEEPEVITECEVEVEKELEKNNGNDDGKTEDDDSEVIVLYDREKDEKREELNLERQTKSEDDGKSEMKTEPEALIASENRETANAEIVEAIEVQTIPDDVQDENKSCEEEKSLDLDSKGETNNNEEIKNEIKITLEELKPSEAHNLVLGFTATKKQKRTKFYSKRVYTSTTTDNLSLTSDKFFQWKQGRELFRNVSSHWRRTTWQCRNCCQCLALRRVIDYEIIAIMKKPFFIPALLLVFSLRFTLLGFICLTPTLVSQIVKGSSKEEAAFTVALGGFMWLCFVIASPCFSGVPRKFHHIICSFSLFSSSLALYLLSTGTSQDTMTLGCCLFGLCHGMAVMMTHTLIKAAFGSRLYDKVRLVFNTITAILVILVAFIIGISNENSTSVQNVYVVLSVLEMISSLIWGFQGCMRRSVRKIRNRS